MNLKQIKWKVVFSPIYKRLKITHIKVTEGGGFCGRYQDHIIPIDQEGKDNVFVLTIDEKYEPTRIAQCCDGDYFWIYACYSNKTGSRKEELELVPELCIDRVT